MIKNGACNLSSINLSEYVINPFTDKAFFTYDQLKQDIPFIVKAMDEIIDENADNHALQEQRDMAKKYRNIGIGIMGLADTFVKLGYKYGEYDSIKFTEEVMQFIFKECVISIKSAMNLTIVKVIKGTAGMVSGLIDQLAISQILGCTYGDDTVMIITTDQDDSYFVRDKLNALLN